VSGERLNIRAERRGRICVVAVSGSLDRAGSTGLAKRIRAERAAHPARLIVDLSGVSSVDPGGAAALAAVAHVVPGQPQVVVRSLRPAARQVLERSGIDLGWLNQAASPASPPGWDGALADSRTASLVREWHYLRGSVRHAIADSRRAAETLASTEDHVAATFARLATRRPDSSARLETVSQKARGYAVQLRRPQPPDEAAEPAPVRLAYSAASTMGRAVAFIEERARDDISVADIAAAAFVTVRALQLAFRRHMGTTPLGYLREVRLEHAHRQLLSADADSTTVTAVAADWRFTNSSRFSAYHRAAYGVSPAHTLREPAPAAGGGLAGVARPALGKGDL